VYFIWILAGFITLCRALTLAELCSLLPRAGASYHFIREGFGPFWAFLLVWMSLWVSGPASVAGLAVSIGEFIQVTLGKLPLLTPVVWGAAAVIFFTSINLLGVEWGGRTQIALTIVKLAGIGALVAGGLCFATPAPPATDSSVQTMGNEAGSVSSFRRFTGLGIAAVLFTYDGWVDVSMLRVKCAGRSANYQWD
jgi:APA family basic amino acid/polyamine antiporter